MKEVVCVAGMECSDFGILFFLCVCSLSFLNMQTIFCSIFLSMFQCFYHFGFCACS